MATFTFLIPAPFKCLYFQLFFTDSLIGDRAPFHEFHKFYESITWPWRYMLICALDRNQCKRERRGAEQGRYEDAALTSTCRCKMELSVLLVLYESTCSWQFCDSISLLLMDWLYWKKKCLWVGWNESLIHLLFWGRSSMLFSFSFAIKEPY